MDSWSCFSLLLPAWNTLHHVVVFHVKSSVTTPFRVYFLTLPISALKSVLLRLASAVISAFCFGPNVKK
jgi:hypothetical protein